jgi:hypothetical protein
MKLRLQVFIMWLLIAPQIYGQMVDRCSPGWSMLNQLREQLTPEIPRETLQLLQVSIAKRLENCREIPDLWYFRALVDEQLNDLKDAQYARKQASALGSEALAEKINPFIKALAKATKLSGTIEEKYALVIGINEFQHASSLRYAVNDAQSMADLLADPIIGRFSKSNIISLLNQAATLQRIKTAIGEIRARASENDLVFIYIASHGSPRKDDPNGVSYILMHDTKRDNAADLYATSLQMIDLVDIIRRDIRAKRVVLILDTCFSGDATGNKNLQILSSNKIVGPSTDFSAATDKFEEKTLDEAARIIISASRADEQSHEDSESKHGFFTCNLLNVLRESKGQSPLRDVFQAVHDRTLTAVHTRFGSFGLTQNPTLRSTPAGLDIVLGIPSSAHKDY